jgi:small GTP-binding protein
MGLLDRFRALRIKATIIGAENSGKTTLLNFLIPDESKALDDVTPTVPTTGFNRGDLNFTKLNTKMEFMDMAGQAQYRKNWEEPVRNSDVVIFVIDAADEKKYDDARNAFNEVVNKLRQTSNNKKIAIMIALNKIDLIEDVQAKYEEMFQFLALKDFITAKNPYQMMSISAKRGDGLQQMLTWIIQQCTGKVLKFEGNVYDEFMIFEKGGNLIVSKAYFMGKEMDAYVPGLLHIINSCVQQFNTTEFKMELNGKILLFYSKEKIVGVIVIPIGSDEKRAQTVLKDLMNQIAATNIKDLEEDKKKALYNKLVLPQILS